MPRPAYRSWQRHRRGSYNPGRSRALQHIEDARRLTEELGGTDQDVKQYFFSLPKSDLQAILLEYGAQFGTAARDYAEDTIERWRTGAVKMSGTVAARLFKLLPPRMPLSDKYRLIENLWNHVGPRSTHTLRVGLDASVERVLQAVREHINDVVVHYTIPDNLERRFEWLAAGDSRVKQELLNHLRNKEKTLVEEGARLQLPVMLEHLRSDQSRHTRRMAQILRIGNHELELLFDKVSSGVAAVDARSTPPSAEGELNWKWAIGGIIAVLVLVSILRQATQPKRHDPIPQFPPAPTTAAPPISSAPILPSPIPPFGNAPKRPDPSPPPSPYQANQPNRATGTLPNAAQGERQRDLQAPSEADPRPIAPTEEANKPARPESSAPLLELARLTDAKRVQGRLIELGFLNGTADGIWGSQSRNALRNFRAAEQMGSDDTWDVQTQARLFAPAARRSAVPATPSELSFVGGWGVDVNQCRESGSRAPINITSRRAEGFGAICEFVSTQSEQSNVWRVQAVCSHEGKRWQANIRLARAGNQLTWSSERGTVTYVQCRR